MKKIGNRLAIGVLMIAGLNVSYADSVAHKIGISGIAAAVDPLGDASVVDHAEATGQDLGGMLSYGLTPNIGIGASYDNIDLYGRRGERHRPEAILANLLLHLSPEGGVVPTLQAGVGVASSQKDGTFNNTTLRVGLGLDFFIAHMFAMGPQVTYTYVANGASGVDEYHVLGVGVLASIFFGGKDEKAAPAQTTAAPEAVAQPAAVVAVPVVAPVDSDGDGVMDSADQCPNTPHGIPVDANGCPKPLEEKVSFELKVLFDTGKSVVKPEYRSEIQQVANFLVAYPQEIAEIEGHTDNTGAEDANQRLSQRRADSVRQVLIKEFSIDPARVTAKGYGQSHPVADNTTPDGRIKNRRVVATLEAVKVTAPNK